MPETENDGPFVYRLGRKIFILERGVRFSYGLLCFKTQSFAHTKNCVFISATHNLQSMHDA